jgi:formamidopyrimidine-DNA glycosylase
MPELPEVETIVRELRPVLPGKTFQKIDIYWQRSVKGDAEQFVEELTNSTVGDVFRRGKYTCFALTDGRHLTIHLGMSGRLIYSPDEKENKYLRARFTFCEDRLLHFSDMRKFGRMQLWQANQSLLPDLGPEPFETERVLHLLSETKSTRAIKTLLLDQRFLAGVGNIYADEALFAAGIHPRTPANKVPKNRLRRLSLELPQILKKAIANKGTTMSDYRTPESSSGSNQFYLKVYGRENQPCSTCSTLIKQIRINARSSHFCPRCQPPPVNLILPK